MVLIKKKTKHLESTDREAQLQKALGLQDRFQLKGVQLVEFVKQRPGWLLGICVVILLALVGNWVFLVFQSHRNEQASQNYFQWIEEAQKDWKPEMPLEDKERLRQKLLSGLEKLVFAYPNSI